MKPHQFTGNETGPYEDPRDNFHYHNHLNPAQQHILWMYQWKQQHLEIHQACKDLGLPTHTDEYTKGFMDGVICLCLFCGNKLFRNCAFDPPQRIRII